VIIHILIGGVIQLKTKQSKRELRDKLCQNLGSRMCVCGRSWGWDGKVNGESDYHCNNTHCTWWNMCTTEHSTPVSKLDQLYELTYDRGFCKCKNPKLHEIDGQLVDDYPLCVNKDCFKVLREYKEVVIDLSLYPRK